MHTPYLPTLALSDARQALKPGGPRVACIPDRTPRTGRSCSPIWSASLRRATRRTSAASAGTAAVEDTAI
jgi:hypothetical protein